MKHTDMDNFPSLQRFTCLSSWRSHLIEEMQCTCVFVYVCTIISEKSIHLILRKNRNELEIRSHICILKPFCSCPLNTTTHTHENTAEDVERKIGERADTLLTNQKSHILLLLSVLLFSLLSLLSLLLYFLLICILSHASLARSLWPPGAASSSADVPALLLPSARWRLSIANQMFFFQPLFWDVRLCQVHRGNRGMVL